MISLLDLWLPIVLSAVFVFVASSIIHMAPLWHRNDYPKMPNEDRVLDALRPVLPPPGDYMAPRCTSSQEMKDPAYLEKLERGPVIVLTVLRTGPFSMAPMLIQWFVWCLVVSLFSGYIASQTLPPGTEYLKVFQIVGASAFMGYTLAYWPITIWYKRGVGLAVKNTIDGLIYALLTAGVFGWLWPH